jgi:DNA-binding CsgD family transcriptional regulator
MNIDQLGKTASRLGDVVLDPAVWPEVLDEICGAVGAIGAGLLQSDVRTPDIPRTKSCDELFGGYFREGWHARDDRANRGVPLLLSGEKVIVDQDIFDPEQMRRAGLYNEFLNRYGFGWFAAIGFWAGPALWALSIQRTLKEGPFESADKPALATLSRRLTEIATLSNSVGRIALTCATDALNTIRQPALALDHRGFILAANNSAEHLFDDELYIHNRRMLVRDELAKRQISELIDQMRVTSDKDAMLRNPIVIRRQRRQPVLVRTLPVHGAARSPFLGARAILTLTPLEARPRPGPAEIAKLFHLTPAEARLACLIAQGLNPQQAAGLLEISRETVRTQLKSIFAKTATHRQSELVAMLSRL